MSHCKGFLKNAKIVQNGQIIVKYHQHKGIRGAENPLWTLLLVGLSTNIPTLKF